MKLLKNVLPVDLRHQISTRISGIGSSTVSVAFHPFKNEIFFGLANGIVYASEFSDTPITSYFY